jgi:hypothetical protein
MICVRCGIVGGYGSFFFTQKFPLFAAKSQVTFELMRHSICCENLFGICLEVNFVE